MEKPILALLFLGLTFTLFNTGCSQGGCTDPASENFDPHAQRNDGSCVYRGCMDPSATNYNPLANVSSGNCTYNGTVSFWSSVACCAIEVSLGGQIIDTIQTYYTGNPGCVNGDGIVRVSRTSGNYTVYARTITGDTSQLYIWEDTINITPNQCLTYELHL